MTFQRQRLFFSLAALALLAACGSTPPASRSTSLVDEQMRLAELFRGTPVDIELQQGGALRVGVPLSFSFDRGRSAVKPPLAKVLDHVASGQRHGATRLQVSAPADAGGNAALARERAAAARDYLAERGIAQARFAAPAAGRGDRVEVLVSR